MEFYISLPPEWDGKTPLLIVCRSVAGHEVAGWSVPKDHDIAVIVPFALYRRMVMKYYGVEERP